MFDWALHASLNSISNQGIVCMMLQQTNFNLQTETKECKEHIISILLRLEEKR